MATTSTQSTAEILREKILEGAFPPGTILRQDALAQGLGVSRTPLRTALAELARDGLVTYEANRGYTVRGFNVDDIRAAFEVRANLEGLACRLAAPRITEAQLDRLQRCVSEGDAILSKGILDPEDLAPYRRLNVEFHETIIEASANPWISDFVNRTHNVPLASDRVFHWEDHAIIFRSHNDHHRILRALRTGDAMRAEALMWEHVTYAGDVLVEHVAPKITDRQAPVTLQSMDTETP
ncbi:GntR family transcriptional regulator [Pararhodobacter sp. CCB-MM2]|uniref:GntR family transcriptional regulator n=1 Tax=Pararhodobacter sp. CCB-MM2 TaxID=1786003 RepID=UPI0008355CF3|nr:GntR family transcriptional regulator [Pararhodobacter sp. CCB-MM2]